MTKTQIYIDDFMRSLAGENVGLNPQLQQIFARILSNDVLLLPDAKIGFVTPDAPTDAYLHISAGESFEFDYDTFLLEFDTDGDYRIVVTPEDPSVFQANKIIWLWGEDGSSDGLIMNQTDGFVDGDLYSSIFSAEAGDSKYITVSMRWRGDSGEVATGPAPYEIELVGVA